MSTFGDYTAKQHILEELEHVHYKVLQIDPTVNPLTFLQLVLEVVAYMSEGFASDQGVEFPVKTVLARVDDE